MQCCVQGVVLEAFGAGNIPDLPAQGWMPWLRQQRKKGLQVSSVAGTPTPPNFLLPQNHIWHRICPGHKGLALYKHALTKCCCSEHP